MTAPQAALLKKITFAQAEISASWVEYWKTYTYGTWQFWANTMLLVLPLIVLFIFLDRRRALLLGFYGYSVHVIFTYIDAFGSSHALWEYPHKAIPLLPMNFALDVSFVPVSYMLLYQWVLNHNKNYYLYAIGLSGFFAFIFKPLLNAVEMIQFYNQGSYELLFIGYVLVCCGAKWITNLFIFLAEHANDSIPIKISPFKGIRRRAKAR